MSILKEAEEIVNGKRQEKYGHPFKNWTQTARLWSAILGRDVSAEEAVLCMLAVKVARECHEPERDNRVDIAGYALVLDMIIEERLFEGLGKPTPARDASREQMIRNATWADGRPIDFGKKTVCACGKVGCGE